MEKRVAIVGAGISGLVACKHALSKGFHPIVFESQSSIGGVWTKTLETTKLQTPKQLYQFSDFPWPSSVTQDFPTQQQVLDYVQSYAHHFHLLRHINFNARVLSITFEGASQEDIQSWHLWAGNGEPFGSGRGSWRLTVQQTHTTHSSTHQTYLVDFLILSLGRFSDIPDIPEFALHQKQGFQGEVIHSMDYAAMDNGMAAECIKGKRIVVVGLQKSALDIAMECSTANGVDLPCTLLYRTAHWNIPNYVPWGVPLAYMYLNRFSELMVHKPGEGFLHASLATMLTPIRCLFSKFVESYIKWKLPLSEYRMVPKHSFLQELSSCTISTVPEGFFSRVHEGSIKLKRTEQIKFCQEGVMVDSEDSPLNTDLVIFATGFKGVDKLKHIFSSPTFRDFISGSPDAAVPLYRQCVHPRIPQVAVLGYSESIANLYTSEIRSKWVAELLDGTFKLPSIKEMEEDVGKWDHYMKEYSGPNYRRSCIGALHIWYNDQLCRDMGLNPKRKKGFLAEWFQPYGPMDYAMPLAET